MYYTDVEVCRCKANHAAKNQEIVDRRDELREQVAEAALREFACDYVQKCVPNIEKSFQVSQVQHR